MSMWSTVVGGAARIWCGAVLLCLAASAGADPVVDFSAFVSNANLVNPGPAHIASGDLDLDGDIDLVVTSNASENFTIRVLRNEGAGQFLISNLAVTYGRPHGVAIADFNADGKPDIAVGMFDVTGGTSVRSYVQIYLGLGLGAFTDQLGSIYVDLPSTNYQHISVAADDFNGDGTIDIAASSGSSASDIVVYANSIVGGVPSFTLATTIVGSGYVNDYDLLSDDFNGDGLPDLASTRGVYLNDGVGGFTFAANLPGFRAVDSGDLDGDGRPELAVVGPVGGGATNRVYIYKSTASGFSLMHEHVGSVASYRDVTLADVNGDGFGDVLLTDFNNDRVRILPGSCGLSFFAPIDLAAAVEPVLLTLADINGDTLQDIITVSGNTGQNGTLEYMLRNATAPASGEIQLCAGAWQVNELATEVSLTLGRYNGGSGAVSVNASTVASLAGTPATAGSDFTALSNVAVNFGPDDHGPKTVTVPLQDDLVYEGNEVFDVLLSAATGGATIGGNYRATVTIIENDNALPTVSVSGPTTAVTGGTTVVLTGSAGDVDGFITAWAWQELGSSHLTLGTATGSSLSFVAPNLDVDTVIQVQVTVTDNSGGQASAVFDLTVLATSLPPVNQLPIAVINVSPGTTVEGGVTVTLDGTASYDPEGGALTWYWTQPVGSPVTLLPNVQSGVVTFVAPSLPTQGLLQFELKAIDPLNAIGIKQISITVNPAPTNTAPVADAGPAQTVPEGSDVSLNGTGSSDANGDTISYSWTQVSGPAVALAGADTAWPGFTAPEISALQGSAALVFELTVNDGIDNSLPSQVTVTVNHVNKAPVVTITPVGPVDEGAAVSLSASATDPDGEAVSYSWLQVRGTPVTLSNNLIANPGFTAPEIPAIPGSEDLEFQLTVSDGVGGYGVANIIVTVNHVNKAPSADAGPTQTVAEGTAVSLDGRGSTDPDGDSLTYSWTQTAGPLVALDLLDPSQPSFTAPEITVVQGSVQLSFSLVVNDGSVDSLPSQVTITVNHVNKAPSADAGPAQTVAEDAVVSLDGKGSTDPDGDSLTYSWTQTAGPLVTLDLLDPSQPGFTAPSVTAVQGSVQLGFSLVVNDGSVDSAPSLVTITVTNTNDAPTADAGTNQTVGEGVPVNLNGGASSDPDNNTLSYAWTQSSGPAVTLNGAGTATPSFTAPSVTAAQGSVQLGFSLVVNDGTVDSAASLVTITVTNTNDAPTANAGASQSVGEGVLVNLNGGASSDPDNNTLSYAWTQSSGPAVTLNGAGTATPSFTAPSVTAAQGSVSLSFSLVVNDGTVDSAASLVTITVTNTNDAPTANAGASQSVGEGVLVNLNGGASSDPDNNTLSYAWTQSSGPVVTLNGAGTATPSFTAPSVTAVQGSVQLGFSLVVNDGSVDSAASLVTITVTNTNDAPTASAGADQNVSEGVQVTLHGEASSDPDSDILTYTWTQISGPLVSLDLADPVRPVFTAPEIDLATGSVLLEFTLTVNDGSVNSNVAMVTVTVNHVNKPPLAVISPIGAVLAGSSVTLSGMDSADPDGEALTWSWLQSGTPAVILSNADTATPSFTAPEVPALTGTIVLQFQLTVTDPNGASHSDAVSVAVVNAAYHAGWRFPRPDRADSGVDHSVYPLPLQHLRKLDTVSHAVIPLALRSGDVDGDGQLELVVLLDDSVAVYRKQEQTLVPVTSWPLNAVDLVGATGMILEDVNGNGVLDILTGVSTVTGARIEIFTGNGTSLGEIASQRSGAHVINPVAWLGNQRMVVSYNNPGGDQRGYGLYNNGAEEWFYQIGPAADTVSVADIDGDHVAELLASLSSTADSVTGTGYNGTGTPTSDDRLYHILVNEFAAEGLVASVDANPGNNQGRVRQLLADLDSDGNLEIVALLAHEGAPGQDKLLVVNPLGGVQFQAALSASTDTGMVVANFDATDAQEVAIINRVTGTAQLYRADLSLLATGGAGVDYGDRLHLAADLNDDGALDLVSSGGNTLRIITAPALQVIESLDFTAAIQDLISTDLDDDGRAELLVSLVTGELVLVGPNRAPLPQGEILVQDNGSLQLRVLPGDPDSEDNGQHTLAITQGPYRGQADLAGDLLTYTADAGARGRDALVVTVTDGAGAQGHLVVAMNLLNTTRVVENVVISNRLEDAIIDQGNGAAAKRKSGALALGSIMVILTIWLVVAGGRARRRVF